MRDEEKDSKAFDEFLKVSTLASRIAQYAAEAGSNSVQAIYGTPWGGETAEAWYSCVLVRTRFMKEYTEELERWAKEHGGVHPDDRED